MSKYIGFLGLLTLVFVVAKLWDKIDWSWWWVFAPIWIPLVIILIVILVLLGVAFVEEIKK